jgi:hypothetical protein
MKIGVLVASLLTMTFAAGALSWVAKPDTKGCRLRVLVFDQFGDRQPWRIGRVTFEEEPKLNLKKFAPGLFFTVGDEVIFPKCRANGVRFIVTLSDGSGKTVVAKIPLVQRRQTVRLRVGESEAYGDVAWSTVRGRITGCRTSGEWWVRSMPMFGATGAAGLWVAEGEVAPDGSFELSGSLAGERHILVVGKGKEPVKAAAFNLTVAGPIPWVDVDATAECRAKDLETQ